MGLSARQARPAVPKSKARRHPRFVRGQILFFIALTAALVLALFTIHYNLTHVSGEPFSDLTNLMITPLKNANFPS